MNDLISRSALLADIEDSVVISARNTISTEMRGIRKTVDRIEKAPTIDAVVVIRCKNCGWYRPEDESCGFWPDEGYRDPEHYCGEGKPRE